MPQMAPMNWTFLFFMFIVLYLLTMVLIYFSSTPMSLFCINKTVEQNEALFWKW